MFKKLININLKIAHSVAVGIEHRRKILSRKPFSRFRPSAASLSPMSAFFRLSFLLHISLRFVQDPQCIQEK